MMSWGPPCDVKLPHKTCKTQTAQFETNGLSAPLEGSISSIGWQVRTEHVRATEAAWIGVMGLRNSSVPLQLVYKTEIGAIEVKMFHKLISVKTKP